MQRRRDVADFGMARVDQRISFDPRHDARYDQDKAPQLQTPASPNALLTVAGTLSQSGIEAWENTSYVQTARNGDCDKMLVRRQRAAAMDERFEQPSRIVLAGVDHRTARGIPPSRRDGRSCPVENWILAVRVSNPKADQSAVKSVRSRRRAVLQATQNLDNQFCAKLALDHHVDGTPVFDHRVSAKQEGPRRLLCLPDVKRDGPYSGDPGYALSPRAYGRPSGVRRSPWGRGGI